MINLKFQKFKVVEKALIISRPTCLSRNQFRTTAGEYAVGSGSSVPSIAVTDGVSGPKLRRGGLFGRSKFQFHQVVILHCLNTSATPQEL
jgi:hypothetical protein